MQLINAPGKLVLPFAASGAKNAIPVDSQIGIVAGAASLTDGFPPLTRTPLAAGGVPPSGLDMNGIIYELSAILRWANAGAGYVYDGTFAADSNVGGYPKGARVLRSDGLGYWFNTTDNNTTDPEANAAAAIAAGWVPDFTNGVAAVTMTNANVTLTPLQYGKPIVVISGLLTGNLNLIFPTGMAGEWTVINNTTGAYSVTCKTAAGTGVVVNTAQLIVGDGTNIYNGNLDAIALLGANVASAGGTADALTVTFGSTIRAWSLIAGIPFWVRASSANATTTPTLAANGLAAKTYVKGAGSALAVGDIAGAGHWLLQQYDASLDKLVLLNPATGVTNTAAAAAIQGAFKNLALSAGGVAASVAVSYDELILGDGAGAYVTERNVFGTITTTATGAGGLDTGALAGSTWYSVWRIGKSDGTRAFLFSLSATAPTMPAGYTLKARVGWFRTDGTANKYPLAFKQYGRRVQYAVTAGSNLTALPTIISGTQGNISTPTWVAGALGNFVPSTAAAAKLLWNGDNNTGSAILAPNNNYGGRDSSGNKPWIALNGSQDTYGGMYSLLLEMTLESMNIYYAANNASNKVQCIGWEDNI